MLKPVLKAATCMAALALLAGGARAADPLQKSTDWQAFGHDLGAQRYSPLTQINADNVAQLQPAWSIHLKPEGYTGRPRLAEATPLVVGDTMYITSPYDQILAVDATTGKRLWTYDLPDKDNPTRRGVSYWAGGEGAPASIVFGSRLGRLYSLNAKTGQLNPGFGENGILNLKTPGHHRFTRNIDLFKPTK